MAFSSSFLRILPPYLYQFQLFLFWTGSGVTRLSWSVKVGAVVTGLSHKLSRSNGEKLVTIRSVSSPTILLLRGLISESESLLYP